MQNAPFEVEEILEKQFTDLNYFLLGLRIPDRSECPYLQH